MKLPAFLTKKKKTPMKISKEISKKSTAKAKPTKSTSGKTSGKKAKVVIYSTKTCPWCAKTKEFLKGNKIPFTNKDVGSNQKNAKEMVKLSGQQGVPVVVANGKVIVGYNPGKIKSALKS